MDRLPADSQLTRRAESLAGAAGGVGFIVDRNRVSDVSGDDERFDADAVREEVGQALDRLFRSGRANAVLAWALVAVVALVLVESVLEFDRQWAVFVAAVGLVALVPPAAHRDWRVMVPWELLVLATLPILVRGLLGGDVGTFATYISLAGLALLVVVELHTFTGLQVTHWFAIALVVTTTLASAAAWAVLRWTFDRYLGTSYLTTNEALMTEFAWVTAAGLAAGVAFDAYFRRRDSHLRRAVRLVVRR